MDLLYTPEGVIRDFQRMPRDKDLTLNEMIITQTEIKNFLETAFNNFLGATPCSFPRLIKDYKLVLSLTTAQNPNPIGRFSLHIPGENISDFLRSLNINKVNTYYFNDHFSEPLGISDFEKAIPTNSNRKFPYVSDLEGRHVLVLLKYDHLPYKITTHFLEQVFQGIVFDCKDTDAKRYHPSGHLFL